MGITSKTFDASRYTITGPHDGYIFMSAPKVNFSQITGWGVAAGVATVNTLYPHGYQPGDTVVISGVTAGIDGRKTISAVNSTTSFRFNTDLPPSLPVEIDPFGESYQPVGNGDLVFATDSTGLENKIVFAAGGFATGRTQMQIMPDQMVHIEIDTESTDSQSGALVVAGGAGINGALSISGLARISGFTYVGDGAEAFASTAQLTNAKTVVRVEGDPYGQIAVFNPSPTASTDAILYADNGDDASGWIDFGITGSQFEQEAFTLTGPNDGYVFFEAPEGTTGKGNLVIATGDKGTENKIIIAAGGFATGREQITVTPDQNVHIEIDTESTDATSGALTVVGGVGVQGAASIDGLARIKGLTYVGEGAEQFEQNAGLTNAKVAIVVEGDPYAQIAITNPTPTASTDVIVYADNGTDSSGWIDVGVTGSQFSQTQFGLTGANDGYVFYEAPVNTTGKGNLVIATGDKGSENAIVIAAGGFSTGREQIKIIPDEMVHIEIDSPSTSPTTGALVIRGGVGITGDVNIQGSISFGGTGTQVGTQNLAVSDPMIFVGNGSTTDDDDLAFVGEYKRYEADGTIKSVTNKVLTDNVATLTSANHGYEPGTQVVVSDVDTTFDGTHVITAVTANTFSYNKTAANVPASATPGFVTAAQIAKSTWTAWSKDNADGVWKLVSNITAKPTNQINYNQVGLVYDSIKLQDGEFLGDVDVAGTTTAAELTVTGATTLSGGVASSFTVTGDVTATTFNGNVNASQITITGTPTANTDATTVEWVRTAIGGGWTEKTADYTVSAGESIWANTAGGTFVITLPANPVTNYDRIRIADIASNWGTTPVTLARNGNLIMGLAENFDLNVKNASVELIYSGPTYGWRFV